VKRWFHFIFYHLFYFTKRSWRGGKPDNANGNEHCATVDLTNGQSILDDVPCSSQFRYICEVTMDRCIRQFYIKVEFSQGRMSAGADAVEKECAAAYHLTSGRCKNSKANEK
jgi:hypothetical protein